MRKPMQSLQTLLPPSPPLSNSAGISPQTSPLPSQASRVLDALHRCRRRPSKAPHLQAFSLPRSQYRRLVRHVAHSPELDIFLGTKARLEYDWDAQEAVIRMPSPSPSHDFFTQFVARRIDTQLSHLRDTYPALRQTLADVHQGASSEVRLEPVDSGPADEEDDDDDCTATTQSPDLQYKHLNARWPSAVFEVAFSQRNDKLPPRAYNYMVGSQGNIAVVVGFDIGYEPPKRRRDLKHPEARILVWREVAVPGHDGVDESDVVKVLDEVFRSDGGASAPGTFAMPLSDFIPDAILQTLPTDVHHLTVDLPYADLAADLGSAETMQYEQEHNQGLRRPDKPRWRKRKRTPLSQTSSSEEREVEREAQRREAKAAARDADYAESESRRDQGSPVPKRRSTRSQTKGG